MRMRRLGIPIPILVLVALALLIGACTATPITLPGAEDGGLWTGFDAGSNDAAAADMRPPNVDVDSQPDAAVSGGDAAMDALSDGVCLECPQPDGMTDGGAGDAAEAGPAADALSDVLTDLSAGDLATGD
jgi:hypothetical protein